VTVLACGAEMWEKRGVRGLGMGALFHAVRSWVTAMVAGLLASAPSIEPSAALLSSPTDAPALHSEGIPGDASCLSDAGCPFARELFVDFDRFGVEGRRGGQWITYDYDEVTRAVSTAQLLEESELSLAVRLIVSEVGADRLLVNRNAMLEAIGILYTVDNRLDPVGYNPENRPEAPLFPGCGPQGTFASCANAQQYLGMATWRALNPAGGYDERVLEAATDVAVTAWWLQENGFIPDFTQGATSYVHRCGDAAYGQPTTACDAHLGRPAGDIRGGNPFTGPIVFKAPGPWTTHGHYALVEVRQIEYDPWWDASAAGDALADLEDAELAPARFDSPDEASADPRMRAIVNGVDPVRDGEMLQRILVRR
jgi:hypothetical protein